MHLQGYKNGLAVAAMAWSKSGNMLATAPQDARTVSVYGIFPKRNNSLKPQLLYQCQRGLTVPLLVIFHFQMIVVGY